jgi:hypothetical protein
MHLRQFIQSVLGLVFLVSSSFASSNTEFTFITHPDGIEITGCVSTCSSVLVVPESIDGVTVTRIGAGAFVSANLDSLRLPETIKHIGGEAFAESGLESIIIPNSVVSTGHDTFRDGIDGDVFVIKPAEQRFSVYDFSSSSNVYACESVDSSGFPFNCTNAYPDITRVELDRETSMSLIDSNGHANVPSIYTMIGDSAFAMSSLSSITLPNTIQHIGEEAFVSTNLSSLILPSSVESISRGTLPEFEFDIYIMKPAEQNFNVYDFHSAANIYACNGIDSNGSPIDCIDAYPEVNRTAIDFQTAPSLIDSNGHAEIPNVYTMITDSAFAMSNLETITIPNSIKHIGSEAFVGTNLSSVVIPSSVVSLADNSLDFEGNIFLIRPSEEQINYYDLSNPENVFVCDFDETSCISIWDDINSSSFALSNTEFTYNVIDGGIELTGCVDICPLDLVIPEVIDNNSVISIGDNAFEDNQLTNVTIGNSVTSVGEAAFLNNQLTSVTIPDSLTVIGDGAFSGNLLSGITIPASLTSFGDYAFENNQLTNVTITYGVTNIGYNAFENNQLHNVSIPGSITSIGAEAFKNNQLTNIFLAEGIQSIEDKAFANNLLTSVSIPSSVVNLRRDAFSGNTGVISGEWRYIERLGDAMLLGCADNCPSDMIIPDYIDGFNVQSIDDEAFSEEGLNSIRFPDGIVHLGQNAFLGNPLTSVTYCRSDYSDWDFGDVEGITPQLDESCGIPNDANENITYAALDIDQNGSFDALTDGLILLRYAFGLRGDSLIDGVIDSNANRTNVDEIEAHIQSLVP